MNALTQPQPATEGQTKQISRVAEDAVANAVKNFTMSKEGAQRVHSNGGEFANRVGAAITQILQDMAVTDKYKEEEVSSQYIYPQEYKGPRSIEEQVKEIAKIFNLDPTAALEYAKTLPALPEGAEGWFVIPKIEALAGKAFPGQPEEQYCRALELAIDKMSKARRFYNYREGALTSKHVRQRAQTVDMLTKLGESQKGDILIIAAQFGLRHRGRSVRRALEIISNTPGEFGLGAFAVICMALVHPERYQRFEELDTDCSGDEYAPDADGDFSGSLCLDFIGGEVEFDDDFVDDADGYYGSVSGFVPQQ